MPQGIGRAEVIASGLIKIVQPESGPPLVAFFYTSGTLYAYNYRGGEIGSLIAQKTHAISGSIQPQSVVILTFSPLELCFRDSGNDIHCWNVTTNTVVTNATLGADAPSSFAHSALGDARFFVNTDPDTYAYYKVEPGAILTQLNPGDELISPGLNGTPGNACYYDGVSAYFPVIGNTGDAGIVILDPGVAPVFSPSDTALPGDPTSDWISAVVGHRLSSWDEAISINDFLQVLFASWTAGYETPVNPFAKGADVFQMHPNAAGTGIVMITFTSEEVCLFDPFVVADESALIWYPLERGPDNQRPMLMIEL